MFDIHGAIIKMQEERVNSWINDSLSESQIFELNHKIGDLYIMKNRDGSEEICKIAYFPLDLEEPTALIEIQKNGFNDFREIPIRFLSKKQRNEGL